MNNELIQLPRPQPRVAITVRQATVDDVPFIDGLQKMHSHMVGFFPKKQMESYIQGEHVLVAEQSSVNSGRSSVGTTDNRELKTDNPAQPLGYIISKDQYLKRDDVGIVYQLNVMPMGQRNLIGASLLSEAFARAAYGCRLFCCWCAQDIRANWFWEACGFVPLAFRTGSRGKQRIHIFWQRRIRAGDDGPGATPYWYPYQTGAGAVREDRLVLPIPQGMHWRDEMPLVLPSEPALPPGSVGVNDDGSAKLLPGGAAVRPRDAAQEDAHPGAGAARAKQTRAQRLAIVRSQSKHLQGCPPGKAAVMTAGGIKYVDRGDAPFEAEDEPIKKKRARKPRRPRAKHDPRHIKQARELRDRYLEQVQREPALLLETQRKACRYDVSRMLDDDGVRIVEDVKLLER